MGTDRQLERPPAMRAAEAETVTQAPRRAVRERRYRPSRDVPRERPGVAATVADIADVASPNGPALVEAGDAPSLERRVGGWNNTALRVSAAVVALVLGALAL